MVHILVYASLVVTVVGVAPPAVIPRSAPQVRSVALPSGGTASLGHAVAPAVQHFRGQPPAAAQFGWQATEDEFAESIRSTSPGTAYESEVSRHPTIEGGRASVAAATATSVSWKRWVYANLKILGCILLLLTLTAVAIGSRLSGTAALGRAATSERPASRWLQKSAFETFGSELITTATGQESHQKKFAVASLSSDPVNSSKKSPRTGVASKASSTLKITEDFLNDASLVDDINEVNPELASETISSKEGDTTYDQVRADLPLAIPFLPAPGYRAFAANVAGDSGFDPLNLCTDVATFVNYREAELKHGRAAMIAALLWPLTELIDQANAESGIPSPLDASGGRVLGAFQFPGESDEFVEVCLAIVLVSGSLIELALPRKVGSKPGDLGFDPLSLRNWSSPLKNLIGSERKWTQEAELKHARLAMVVFAYDVINELLTSNPVVENTEYTFHMLDKNVFNPQYWTFQPDVLDGLPDAATLDSVL